MGPRSGWLQVEPAAKEIELNKYAEQVAQQRNGGMLRLGVDVSIWIYRLACHMGQGTRLLNGLGLDETMVVEGVRRWLGLLCGGGTVLVLVFDGRSFEGKEPAHAERRRNKERAIAKIQEATAKGEALKASWFAASVSLPDQLQWRLISMAAEQGHHVVASPYEADSQLEHMYHRRKIDAAFTADADLVFRGVRTIRSADSWRTTGCCYLYEPGDVFDMPGLLPLLRRRTAVPTPAAVPAAAPAAAPAATPAATPGVGGLPPCWTGLVLLRRVGPGFPASARLRPGSQQWHSGFARRPA